MPRSHVLSEDGWPSMDGISPETEGSIAEWVRGNVGTGVAHEYLWAILGDRPREHSWILAETTLRVAVRVALEVSKNVIVLVGIPLKDSSQYAELHIPTWGNVESLHELSPPILVVADDLRLLASNSFEIYRRKFQPPSVIEPFRVDAFFETYRSEEEHASDQPWTNRILLMGRAD